VTYIVITNVLVKRSVPGAVPANAVEEECELRALTVGETIEHRLRGVVDGWSRGGEELLTLTGELRVHDSSVFLIARTRHKTGTIEPVKHSGDIRARCGQVPAEFATAGAVSPKAFDDLEEFELRGGHAEGFEYPRQRSFNVRGGGTERMNGLRGSRGRFRD